MFSVDEFLDPQTLEPKVVDSKGELKTTPMTLPSVEPFDEPKANEIISMLEEGKGLRAVLKELSIPMRTYNNWKKLDENFKVACVQAQEARADLLLETTYEDDIAPAYEMDEEQTKKLDFLSKRNRLALHHLKHLVPNRFKNKNDINLTQQNATLKINLPEDFAEKVSQFIPKIKPGGGLEL